MTRAIASADGASENTLSVVIADDQALVRAGFRLILESRPDIRVVAEAGDGAAAIAAVRRFRPDVLLLDIRMPGMDGLEATRRLSAEPAVSTRIVVLTTFDLDEYVYGALRAGASGFLLKDVTPKHLVAAVRQIVTGDTLLAPSVTRRLVERFLTSERVRDVSEASLRTLTAREQEILLLVARGLSNAEIADRLVVGTSTVKTHVASLLGKLDLRDRVQLVVLAYETGLIRPTGELRGMEKEQLRQD